MKSPLAPICIVATICLTACSDDTSLIGTSTGGEPSTGTTAPPEPTSTSTPTTGDIDPTSTPTDTTSTGVDDETTTSGPPPDPTTGEPDECPDRPDGSYQDCVNGAACDGDRATCLVDNPDDESFGICSLLCQDDCDCFADPGNATAVSTCAPLLEGGEKACVLDCSGGKTCPAGSSCQPDFAICVYGVEVAEQADLTLNEVYLDEHALEPGSPTAINFVIDNIGAGTAPADFVIRAVLSKNDVFGDDDDIVLIESPYPEPVEPNTPAGWFADIEIPADVFDGEYHVAMALDTEQTVAESDETNNVLFDPELLVISGNPMPGNADLGLENAVAAAHQVLQGAETNFSFDVKNLAAAAVPAYSVGLYYSKDPQVTTADTLICTHNDDDGLAAMAQEAKQVACAVPKLLGEHYFGAIVDPADMLEELDETNNMAADAAPVTISAPVVDLVMGAVSSDDNTVDVGQLVTLSATVSNTGTDPSPGFATSFYLSTDANITAADKLACTKPAGLALPAGQQTIVSSQCAIPPVSTGAYWLGAIADANAAITETDETNNDGASAAQLQVKAADVDLIYELHWDNVGIAPDPGDTLTWHLQIRNNGTAASPPKFDIALYYSTDESISGLDYKSCTVNLGPVPAKTITEFQFECTVPQMPAAWYYSGVIIDSGDTVPETNEDNNIGVSVNPELIQE